MNRLYAAALLVTALCLAGARPARAATADRAVDGLGPFRLGATYDSLKGMTGFEADPSRDDAAQHIKAARIIGPFSGQIAIQRLFFKDGRLVRISIIFGDPAFDEAKVKALVALEWGDPGARQDVGGGQRVYRWSGTRGTAMLVPADGGRWLVGILEDVKTPGPAAGPPAAAKSDAAEYVSSDKGFAVVFPAPPTVTAVAAPAGSRAMTQIAVETRTQAYVVVVVDWTSLDDDADLRLDAQRDAMVAQPGGKLLAERYLATGGRPVREIRMTDNRGAYTIRAVFDGVGKRTFTVVAGGTPTLDEAVATAFLDSFRFLSSPEPQAYLAPDAGFSATFPGPVTVRSQETEAGLIREVQASADGIAFMVAVFDAKTKLDGSPELRLDNGRDGAVKATRGGRLLSEKKVTLAGMPGREIELSAANNLGGVHRLFLDTKRNRLFTLMVISRQPRLDKARAAAFFESFQLTANK